MKSIRCAVLALALVPWFAPAVFAAETVNVGYPRPRWGPGTETRRALVLILYDSSQPAATPANDWTPKRLCKNP